VARVERKKAFGLYLDVVNTKIKFRFFISRTSQSQEKKIKNTRKGAETQRKRKVFSFLLFFAQP
jgi:hypothetical protein